MIIRLKVFEQTLSIIDTKSVPRKGSKDYLLLQFAFSSDWKDLDKVCYLQKGDVSQPIDVVDGIVEVPEWFTEQDSFDVTLFGTNSSQEVPTNVVALQLEKSNTLWEKDAPEPQPSWLAKIIDLNNHPPVPGDNGYWMLWNTESGVYVESDLPLPEMPVGPQGPQGEPGPEGPAGAAGQDGKSAYTAAQEGGYTGAEAEFNAALASTPGHIADIDIHVTNEEKTAWSAKQDTLTGTEGQAVIFDADGKAAAADTTETELMGIPAGVLKGTSSGISVAEAGKDYMGPVAVTAADNGKFLRVVNGAWAAASVADASGVSF